jgi:hypothetical protein
MFRTASVLPIISIAFSTAITAQNYTGTFSATNDEGGQTVVTLQQSSDGSVVGSISGKGNTLQMQGVLEQGSLVGAVSMGQQGGLWFEAELVGNQLALTLVEPDANGMPNYATATTLQFIRANAGGTSQGSSAQNRKPATGKREASGNTPTGQDRSGRGATAGGVDGGGGVGGLDDGTALGREWSQWLAGNKVTKMDSYSSGGAGGYSMRIDTHLCGSGEFVVYDQSSVSVDVGGASGYSGGNGSQQGTWRVLTQGQAVGIELRYGNGQAEVHELTYQDGATYANGERVYVTPSDVCR